MMEVTCLTKNISKVKYHQKKNIALQIIIYQPNIKNDFNIFLIYNL